MSKVSLEDIQKLRSMTSMGMLDCKKALEQAEGDMDKAIELLRKKGASIAAKRGDNQTAQGYIHAYIHPGSSIGVMIELNCETDFVARNEDFKKAAQDICMHIAAMKPLYLAPEEVDAAYLEKEKKFMTEKLVEEGKKPDFIANIVEGKVKKLYSEICLLEQTFVKDDKLTIKEVISGLIGKVGENVKIRRFARFEIGA